MKTTVTVLAIFTVLFALASISWAVDPENGYTQAKKLTAFQQRQKEFQDHVSVIERKRARGEKITSNSKLKPRNQEPRRTKSSWVSSHLD
ncbi:Hypothetical predicted protein [Cloeon dipterum]|uniref:Uncharacterized protein n=1 Tax=Cloeon dipterum TaxID=197152 RepID=A0A8S1E0T5_9INSE|nr:Hypothetical predicted protein [Cloeon dipterum]